MVTKLEEQITQRVMAARERAKIDRQIVADALSLDANSYGHYERGRSAFTVEQLFVLSKVLSKPVAWFLGLESKLREDEQELLYLYNELAEEDQRLMLDDMRLHVKYMSERKNG